MQLCAPVLLTVLGGDGRLTAASGQAAAREDAAAAENADAQRISRVRALSPSVAALVHEAAGLSPTFRRLVRTIDASDGLVYVDAGTCPRTLPACLGIVRLDGPTRVLRIFVTPRFRTDRRRFMASIGHELQHAVEVLTDRTIRTHVDYSNLYERLGGWRTFAGNVETRAAREAGRAVSQELQKADRSRSLGDRSR